MLKTANNEELFYDANENGDIDPDNLSGDEEIDMIDDEMIDEEAQLELQQKQAIDRAASFDSESASNSSPMQNQKKIRSLRHAATLAE